MLPKISFGIIALNGEPFTRYNLRSLYPFAHEIIIVEGACLSAAGIATADGHSIDATLDVLYRFKKEEDPEDKVRIITKDGFWEEKDDMSRAYAERATGDYLWQVDIDEFYKPEDMAKIMEMLEKDSGITAVSFKQITFWGGFDYVVDGWLFRRGFAKYWAQRYHRLFKWGQGYRYVTHRPPTVYDSKGEDLRNIKWLNGDGLAERDIFLYHYSLVFPRQVQEKCAYYAEASKLWGEDRRKAKEWSEEVFFGLKRPYRMHNVYRYPAWIDFFYRTHPAQIEQLREDIKKGDVAVELRPDDDIKFLLKSPLYCLGKVYFKALEPFDRVICGAGRKLKEILKKIK